MSAFFLFWDKTMMEWKMKIRSHFHPSRQQTWRASKLTDSFLLLYAEVEKNDLDKHGKRVSNPWTKILKINKNFICFELELRPTQSHQGNKVQSLVWSAVLILSHGPQWPQPQLFCWPIANESVRRKRGWGLWTLLHSQTHPHSPGNVFQIIGCLLSDYVACRY